MQARMSLKDRIAMLEAGGRVQDDAITRLHAEAAALRLAAQRLREAAGGALAAMRATATGDDALAEAADALAAALDPPAAG